MLQSPRVYGLSIWLEVSHPFNSLKRDKDLHTFPKITQCHHQHVYATISAFNRDTIVICQGRRLQRRRHLNSKLLLECELTDSIRSRSYYVYTYKLWEFAVVCPFVPSVQTSFLACAIFWRLSYVHYHALIPYNTQSINFDGFNLHCNPLCTIFPRFS